MRMGIRKYIVLLFFLILLFLLGLFAVNRLHHGQLNRAVLYHEDGVYSLSQTQGSAIQLYLDGQWKNVKLRGVQLTAFYPGYQRSDDQVDAARIKEWLKQISMLNANVIYIPYLQAHAFYKAIYEYNLQAKNPLYIFQGIPLDESAGMNTYDAFHYKVMNTMKKDIRVAVNALHGQGVSIPNRRYHSGVYFSDISRYVLGYVIGENISPELVNLTNAKHPDITSYKGKHFQVNKGTAIDCFAAQMLDDLVQYERKQYRRQSLVSFYSSAHTDPLAHPNESKITRKANINLENIKEIGNHLLFAGYNIHPNGIEFLSYDIDEEGKQSTFKDYVTALNRFHQLPVVIIDTGMSSSRGMSDTDRVEGYNRGWLSEEQQGEKLVQLLKDIEASGSAGVIVNSWQDHWNRKTIYNPVFYFGATNSSLWQNVQASDEGFGLVSFEYGNEKNICYVDGDIGEWGNVPALIDEQGLSMKAQADTKYLYLLIQKMGWSLSNDSLYIGIDISGTSGSNVWSDKNARFSLPVDFILSLKGYNESDVQVQARSDVFSYQYKYYNNLLEKQTDIPAKDSGIFHNIFMLNRRNIYLRHLNRILPPLYYETGKLVHGNANPSVSDYNSLADFCKLNESTELRIPWSMINIIDPLTGRAIVDCYVKEKSKQIQKISQIGFAVCFRSGAEEIVTKPGKFRLPNLSRAQYHTRLKRSYFILQQYWGSK